MTGYSPLFSLRYPMELLPTNITEKKKVNNSYIDEQLYTNTKLPRISQKKNSILTEINQKNGRKSVNNNNNKDDLSINNSINYNNKSSHHSDSYYKRRSSNEPKQNKSILNINNGENSIHSTPRSKKSTDFKNIYNETKSTHKNKIKSGFSDNQINQWIDLTQNRAKIFDNMMNHHKLEKQRVIGGEKSTQIDIKNHQKSQNQQILNKRVSDKETLVSKMLTPSEQLEVDVKKALQDIERELLVEILPDNKKKKQLFNEEYVNMNSKIAKNIKTKN